MKPTTVQSHAGQTTDRPPADHPLTPRRGSGAETLLAVASSLLVASIFGFFFAWVCSTMWGLDAADPRVAIEAMQEMNASVRNGVFAPAFFATPVVTGLWAAVAWRGGNRRRGALAAAAALTYLVGGLLFTVWFNLPLNADLAAVTVPTDLDTARAVWHDYSETWQLRNQLRTGFSGLAMVLVTLALLSPAPRPGSTTK